MLTDYDSTFRFRKYGNEICLGLFPNHKRILVSRSLERARSLLLPGTSSSPVKMLSKTLFLLSLLFVYTVCGLPISDPSVPQAEGSEPEKRDQLPTINEGTEGTPLNLSSLFPASAPVPALRQGASQAGSAATNQDIDVLGQVNKILQNVATLNLAGVVEESLNTAASPAVQEFVNGIVRGVFCNPITSIFNTCTSASSNTGTGTASTSSSSSSSSSSASTSLNSLGGTGNSNLGSLANLFG